MRGILLSLFMPPTGLVTLAFIGLLIGRRRRLGGLCLWTAVIGLYLLSTPLVSHTMLVALEQDLPTTPPPGNPPGAIIVLGGEMIRTHDMPLGARPGPLTLERLATGAALARRTGLPLLVTGGLAHPTQPAVGAVMAASLKDDFGTPARWVEDKSVDTWENARLSAKILHEAGIRSVYVVTSAWHMRRALQAFGDTGLAVTAAPTPIDASLAPLATDLMPRVTSWLTAYYALHEWVGYAWYRVR
ncbi:MAG: YdcF family protein [Acetobacteraceae bacterium]